VGKLEFLNYLESQGLATIEAVSAEPDRVVEELSDLAFQIVGQLRAEFNAAAAALDLPPAQAMALANLRSPAPMRELAAWLACDASNVTGIVDGLERRGLVTRRPDPADRRVKHLVLTPEGERRRQLLRTHNHERASALFALPIEDLHRLRDLLARLVHDGHAGRCEGNPAAPTA
jgi:DNA-binding MarR family transcriptional regulator